MIDNLTDEDGRKSVDPERYDPDEQTVCAKCGSDLRGAGDALTIGMYCPECNMEVWIS